MLSSILHVYREAFRGLPREAWLLSLVALINRAGTMVLPFLSLYLTEDRGVSVTGAGRILAVYGLGAAAGSYLGGWLSDRIGATRTQIVSMAASGVAFFAFLLLDSPLEITLGAFVLSVVVETLRPAVMTDMANRVPGPLQVRAFALLRLAVNLGMGIGPAVAGFLALRDYAWLFVVDAVSCWIAALLLVGLLVRSPVNEETTETESAASSRSPWRDGPFLMFMALMTMMAAVFFQVFSTLPLFFRRGYDFGEGTIGLLLALNAALIVAFEMVLIHRLEQRERLMLVGLGAFLVGAGLGLMPLGSSIPFVALTIVVWTFGEMLALPIANAVVADRAGRAQRGRYMGVYMMAYSVAFVFAPAGGTWVFDRFGAETLWYGSAAVGALLWLWALSLRRALGSSGRGAA